MDLDPFHAVGITADTMRFLDIFLLHCLLRDSPPDTPQEIAAIVRNQQRVAARGREPGLRLSREAGEVALGEWSSEILTGCAPIASALDAVNGGNVHRDSLAGAVAALDNPAATPSARILQAMAREHGNSHVRFVLAQSVAHRRSILDLPYPAEIAQRFVRLADESMTQQRAIEAADTLPFESYRQLYLAPFRLHE
jgi:glutamate--cysteine ligase